MDFQHLQEIREQELSVILPYLPNQGKLLEIGAGSGWQAKEFSRLGYEVEAIDVKGSDYADHRVWPVVEYNGKDIPYPDQSFDVVFSSNVLEHILQIQDFQKEIKRVLKDDGLAVHAMPNAAWRFYTNITYYLVILTRLTQGRRPSVDFRIRRFRIIFPSKHGEQGNALTELVTFGDAHWTKIFRSTGWRLVNRIPNRLFYTGYSLFGKRFNMQQRIRLSSFLGSISSFWVLRKDQSR